MELNYTDRVYKLLMDLGLGQVIIIDQIVAPENRDKFIVACQRYYNDLFYHPDHQIKFDNDYSRITKVAPDYFPEEKQQP